MLFWFPSKYFFDVEESKYLALMKKWSSFPFHKFDVKKHSYFFSIKTVLILANLPPLGIGKKSKFDWYRKRLLQKTIHVPWNIVVFKSSS